LFIYCNRLSAVLPEDPSNKYCRLLSVVGLSRQRSRVGNTCSKGVRRFWKIKSHLEVAVLDPVAAEQPNVSTWLWAICRPWTVMFRARK